MPNLVACCLPDEQVLAADPEAVQPLRYHTAFVEKATVALEAWLQESGPKQHRRGV